MNRQISFHIAGVKRTVRTKTIRRARSSCFVVTSQNNGVHGTLPYVLRTSGVVVPTPIECCGRVSEDYRTPLCTRTSDGTTRCEAFRPVVAVCPLSCLGRGRPLDPARRSASCVTPSRSGTAVGLANGQQKPVESDNPSDRIDVETEPVCTITIRVAYSRGRLTRRPRSRVGRSRRKFRLVSRYTFRSVRVNR